jgi:hypothetical protein
MKNHLLAGIALLFAMQSLNAQTKAPKNDAADSLLNTLDADSSMMPVVIFKSTRLILSQSTETVKKNNFNFEIVHRFGDFAGQNGGGQYFYGLDDIADVTLRFEYGLTDNFNADLERSTIGGLVDLGLKYALLHQQSGGGIPVAITLLGEEGVRPYGSFQSFDDRLSAFGEVLFAHKFSSFFSLQVAPSFLRDNTPYPVQNGIDRQFFSLSATAVFQLTHHLAFLVDYAHPFSSYRTTTNGFYDPLGLGIQIETGGHVFTLNITNARAISEINYLSDTESDFSKGQYRIGFTISRMFDFNHKEAYK